MLKDIKIKATNGKTKCVGRFENIAAMVEYFKANLIRADLRDANLSRADLRDANLSRVNLSGADLSGADLRDANLSRVNLSGADLSGADLSGADLRDANLSGADLRDANLSGVNLSRADLRDANLSGADLSGVNIDFASWPLWCRSFNAIVDRKQKIQILEHAIRLIENNDGDEDLTKSLNLILSKKQGLNFIINNR